MAKERRPNPPKLFWRFARLPPRLFYRLGLGPLIGRVVLLLTTTGRKSGLARVTPLQYEEIDGAIYIGAARGLKADWFRNIVANPEVDVQVKARRFRGVAEPVTDPVRIADFLQVRLRRHPKMVGWILSRAGLPRHPTRAQIEGYSAKRAMVIIRPSEGGSR